MEPNQIKKPSVMKFVIIIVVVLLVCVIAGIAISKKSKSMDNAVSNEETGEMIKDFLGDNSEEEMGDSVEDDNMGDAEETVDPYTDTERDYIIPDSDSRYLSRSDIEGLTKDELRIARNEIFARRGRTFKDEQLQSYFDSKDWYYGTVSPDDFSENMMNDYEIENSYLIADYETEMGYR